MTAARTSPMPALTRGRSSFDLLVAYEDAATRHRALHLSHHLSQQFANDHEFHCSWWKFDHLANRMLREQAALAAAEANMIVLAVNARPKFPDLQSEWIERWLPLRRARRSRSVNGALVALVALMAGSEPVVAADARQTTDQLRQIADAARLDFFAHAFELPTLLPNADPSQLVETPTPREVVTEANLEALSTSNPHFKMPIPRWGINE